MAPAFLLLLGCGTRDTGMKEWTFGPDGRIARSLGHFDEAAYRAQLQGSAQPTS
jgi:hypothetical protein